MLKLPVYSEMNAGVENLLSI